MRSKKLGVLVVLFIVALLVLLGGPGLALRLLGVMRQGSVQEALAAAPSATDAPGGDPLDSLIIGRPGSEWTATYSVQELWAVEVTGRLDTER